MKWRRLHPWDITYDEAVRIQIALQERLILRPPRGPLRSVAGADVSSARRSGRVFAAVLVFSYPDLELLEERVSTAPAAYPYVPGLLTFREAPVLLGAFAQVTTLPDVILFDGQGIAHPRRMGLAAHCGILLDRPAIGCAKSRLVGDHGEVGPERGAWAPLRVGRRTVGAVLRSRDRVRPLYVSPGHRMNLHRSRKIILQLCRGYRLPEPLRRAHLAVTRLRLECGG